MPIDLSIDIDHVKLYSFVHVREHDLHVFFADVRYLSNTHKSGKELETRNYEG